MIPKFCAAALCAVSLVYPAMAAERPPAADAAAPVKPHEYNSAFSTYRPYEEPPLRPWPEVNEEVAKAGGHIGIFRDAGRAAPGQPPVRGAPEAPGVKPHHH